MAVCAAPEEEEGAFRGDDRAWSLQSKQGERKKHESFLELCCSAIPTTVCVQEGGGFFQQFKGF